MQMQYASLNNSLVHCKSALLNLQICSNSARVDVRRYRDSSFSNLRCMYATRFDYASLKFLLAARQD
jgi:hypothetical protein